MHGVTTALVRMPRRVEINVMKFYSASRVASLNLM